MVRIQNLSNGIRVVLEQMDYLHSVSFGVWVRCGSAFEDIQTNGMAHMIEHMLFKGTENRTAKMIADDTARIGGSLNAYTTKEYTVYDITVLEEHLGEAVRILGDMLLHSRFDELEFEKEKGVVLEEIGMYEDSPEDMVHEMMQKNVWKEHSLGYLISGSAETVEQFSAKQAADFLREFYTAENIILSIAGRFEETEIMEICETVFAAVPVKGAKSTLSMPAYYRSFYTREQDIEQLHMNLAVPCITTLSEERMVFAVANTMFGGSESSRLFQEIREERGLSYSVFSYGSPFEQAGLWQLDIVANPSNLREIYDRTLEAMENLKKDGITQEELHRTREQLKTDIIIGNESAKSRGARNGRKLLCGDRLSSEEETLRELDAVETEDVRQFCRRYLDVKELSLSFVGPTGCPELAGLR